VSEGVWWVCVGGCVGVCVWCVREGVWVWFVCVGGWVGGWVCALIRVGAYLVCVFVRVSVLV
jgi:hypothetical protein